MTEKDDDIIASICCWFICILISISIIIVYWYVSLPIIIIIVIFIIYQRKKNGKTQSKKQKSIFSDDGDFDTEWKEFQEKMKREEEADRVRFNLRGKCCPYCGTIIDKSEHVCPYCKHDFDEKEEKEDIKEGRSRNIPIAVQREVWRRDLGKCVECGSKERLEYDHIIPFSLGGSNTTRNIQLLCENCNRKKSNNI